MKYIVCEEPYNLEIKEKDPPLACSLPYHVFLKTPNPFGEGSVQPELVCNEFRAINKQKVFTARSLTLGSEAGFLCFAGSIKSRMVTYSHNSVTSRNEHATFGSGHVSSPNDIVANGDDTAVRPNGCATIKNEHVSSRNDIVANENHTVTDPNGCVTVKNEHVSSQNDTIANGNHTATGRNECTITGNGQVSGHRDIL